jgi:hypothetical protein
MDIAIIPSSTFQLFFHRKKTLKVDLSIIEIENFLKSNIEEMGSIVGMSILFFGVFANV